MIRRQTLVLDSSELRTRQEVWLYVRGSYRLKGMSWCGTMLCARIVSENLGAKLNSKESKY